MGTAKYPTHKTVLEHYGFFKDPFGEALDPELFYPARSHMDVLDCLEKGLKRGVHLQVITSEPGVGKTTVLKLLHDRLNEPGVVFHCQPTLRSWESLQYLLLRLGITSDAKAVESLQQQLIEALDNKRKAGVSISLIIDEAQNLGEQVLALLQSPPTKQSGQTKLFKVVLAVQSSSSATLRELGRNDDPSPILEVKRLDSDEVTAYIAHRLRCSGPEGQEIFTPDAVRKIAEYSRGVPREINMVCSEALRLCLESGGSRTVDERCLERIIALHSTSHEMDTVNLIEPFPVKGNHRKGFNPKVLVEELEQWFGRHDHNWSGTRSELLTELQGQIVSSGLSAERSEDIDQLLTVLEDNLPELEKSGVGVSIKRGAGNPVVITLKHISSQSESRTPIDLMKNPARLGAEGHERMDEAKLYDQSSSASSFSHGENPTDPVAKANSADATSEQTDNDYADALRRALHESTDVRHAHRVAHFRRSKLLIVLLVLTLLGIALILARQSFLVGKSQDGRHGARKTPDGAKESHEGSSTSSKLMREAEPRDFASQLALATGDRTKRNNTEAVRSLREAAAQGEPDAAYRLANAYRTGQDLPVNKVAAYCWYVIAAGAGRADSDQQIKTLTAQLTDRDIANVRYELGRMYLNGTGVGTGPDKLTAYFWFRLAEVAGHPDAMRAEKSLVSQMGEVEVKTAAAKASKWLQVHPPRLATNSRGR